MKTLVFILAVCFISFALIVGVVLFVIFMEALADSGFFDAVAERLTEKLKKKLHGSDEEVGK